MRTQKLGEFIEKWHIKKDDWKGSKKLEVLGVSNVDGITVTSHKKSKDLSKYLVIEPNCFAYNPYRINVGSIGLTPEDTYGLVSPAYTVFKVKENKLIPELLLDFLKSFDGLQQINKYARGTVRKALRYDDLCEIKVNFPSYEEQKIIFNKKLLIEKKQTVLSEEIHNQKQLISQLKQAILQETIQGKLTQEWREQNPNTEPASELLERIKTEKEQLIKHKKIRKEKPLPPITQEEIPFEIPESWSWCRLGEVCRKVTDGFHNTPPKIKEGYPYIAATHVKSDKIDWQNADKVSEKFHRELYNKANPQKGEILVVNIGAGSGCPAIIDVDFEFSFKNTAILKFNQDLIFNKYLFYYLISIQEENYKMLTRGANQPFLSLKVIKGFIIPIPPFKEQKAIVEKVETLMQKCNELEQEITQSEQHANMLMQAVLKEAFESKEEIVNS